MKKSVVGGLMMAAVCVLAACASVSSNDYVTTAESLRQGKITFPYKAVPPDVIADVFITMAANNGNPQAEYLLAKAYEDGDALSGSDFTNAYNYLGSVMGNGCPTGFVPLGGIRGDACVRDESNLHIKANYRSESSAQTWLAKAVKDGFAPTDVTSACDTEFKIIVSTGSLTTGATKYPGVASQLFNTCQQAASEGDAPSEVILARFYEQGVVVSKPDITKAYKLYAQAAAQGNPAGQYELAELYKHGRGVARDENKALSLYSQAAGQNYLPAVYEYAYLQYENNAIIMPQPVMNSVAMAMQEIVSSTDTSVAKDQAEAKSILITI